MQGGIAFVHVVQNPVEKELVGALPSCTMSRALFREQRRGINQTDGSGTITRDDDVHKIPEGVNLDVAGLQFFTPQDGQITTRG